MYIVAIFSAVLCISNAAIFIGHSLNSDLPESQTTLNLNEYPTSEETSKRLVREPPLIKRELDPFSIPSLVKEPPLKRGDKRDVYIYPSTSSQLSARVPLREPPLKRSESIDDEVFFFPYKGEEQNRYNNNLYDLGLTNAIWSSYAAPEYTWRLLLGRSHNQQSKLEPPVRSQLWDEIFN